MVDTRQLEQNPEVMVVLVRNVTEIDVLVLKKEEVNLIEDDDESPLF